MCSNKTKKIYIIISFLYCLFKIILIFIYSEAWRNETAYKANNARLMTLWYNIWAKIRTLWVICVVPSVTWHHITVSSCSSKCPEWTEHCRNEQLWFGRLRHIVRSPAVVKISCRRNKTSTCRIKRDMIHRRPRDQWRHAGGLRCLAWIERHRQTER